MEIEDSRSDAMARLLENAKRQREAFLNRRVYEELSPIILATIPDEDLEDAIVNYVSLKVGNDMARKHEIITSLPPGYQAVYTTLMVDLEVPNGGFNQYFWNRGEFALEAVQGYLMIGASEHAKVMEEAVSTYLAEVETQKQFRLQDTLQAFSESYKHTKLGRLDEQYYGLNDDPTELRIKLVRQHPEAFASLVTS